MTAAEASGPAGGITLQGLQQHGLRLCVCVKCAYVSVCVLYNYSYRSTCALILLYKCVLTHASALLIVLLLLLLLLMMIASLMACVLAHSPGGGNRQRRRIAFVMSCRNTTISRV
jgi:hypothetical protein